MGLTGRLIPSHTGDALLFYLSNETRTVMHQCPDAPVLRAIASMYESWPFFPTITYNVNTAIYLHM